MIIDAYFEIKKIKYELTIFRFYCSTMFFPLGNNEAIESVLEGKFVYKFGVE